MKFELIVAAAILLIVAILAIGSPLYCYMTDEWVNVTVTGKERIAESGGGTYLVFTESETLENTDSLFYWKWRSSDIYSRITPGEYRFRVYGWRIPIISFYRNIIEVSNGGANECKKEVKECK